MRCLCDAKKREISFGERKERKNESRECEREKEKKKKTPLSLSLPFFFFRPASYHHSPGSSPAPSALAAALITASDFRLASMKSL